MSWEYLETHKLDERFERVAQELDVKDKVLLDLNSGSFRFSRFVSGYKAYYANDIVPWDDVVDRGGVTFIHAEDAKIPRFMKDEQIDILMLWGYAGGHLYSSDKESNTLFNTIKELVTTKDIGEVIVEGSIVWNKNHHCLDELLYFLVYRGYNIVYISCITDELDRNSLSNRKVCILRKRKKTNE